MHKLTTKLVRYAKENNPVITVGDLEGIQDRDKGRVMNRKLHRFPHYEFRRQVKYKAKWGGMLCLEVSEAYTSRLCTRCGKMGRKYKGRFECPHCGYVVDRDKNGAQNIGQRALETSSRPLSSVGAAVARPEAGSYDFSSALQENERKATSAA